MTPQQVLLARFRGYEWQPHPSEKKPGFGKDAGTRMQLQNAGQIIAVRR